MSSNFMYLNNPKSKTLLLFVVLLISPLLVPTSTARWGSASVYFNIPSTANANSYTSAYVEISGAPMFIVGPGYIQRCTGSPCSTLGPPSGSGWTTVRTFTLDQPSMTIFSVPTGSAGINVKFRVVVAPMGSWISDDDYMTINGAVSSMLLESVDDVYYGDKTRFNYHIYSARPSSAKLQVREQGTSVWSEYSISTSIGSRSKYLELVPGEYESRIKYVTNGNTKHTSTRYFEVGQRILFLIHGFSGSPDVWDKVELEGFIDSAWSSSHTSRNYLYDDTMPVDYYEGLTCDWDNLENAEQNFHGCAQWWVPIGPGQYNRGDDIVTVDVNDVNLAKRVFDGYINNNQIIGSLNTKIDLVAHSMGGLVTRAMIQYYIQSLDSWNEEDLTFELNGGKHQLNKLIFLGTPNQGLDINERLISWLLPDQVLMMDNTADDSWVTDRSDLNPSLPEAMSIYTLAGLSRENFYLNEENWIGWLSRTFIQDYRENKIMDGLIVRENVHIDGSDGHWEFYYHHDDIRDGLAVKEFVGGLLGDDPVTQVEFTFSIDEIGLIDFAPSFSHLGEFEIYVNNQYIYTLDYAGTLTECHGAPTGPNDPPGIFAIKGLRCNVWKTIDITLDVLPSTKSQVVIEMRGTHNLDSDLLIGYTMFYEVFDQFFNINHYGIDAHYHPSYPGDTDETLILEYYLF